MMRGDLGESTSYSQPVVTVIAGHVGATLKLLLLSMAIAVSVGMAAGGCRRGSIHEFGSPGLRHDHDMITDRIRVPSAARPTAAAVGAVIVTAFGALALLAPLLAPADPNEQDLLAALAGPSARHWLGTDALGRDILSRIVYGAQFEMAIVLPSVLLAAALALPFGLMSGYLGKWADRIISTLSDSLLTFPALIVTQAPQMVRYLRGFTRQVASSQYILAARAAGSRLPTIIGRHVLRNIIGPMLVILSLFASEALLVIAALGFLGIGVQPPTPEWGTMLSEGRADFIANPHVMIFPGLAIAVLILGFNLLGDGLRDRLDNRN
jgi:peptide/nickel transport system permease protein